VPVDIPRIKARHDHFRAPELQPALPGV